MGEGEEGGEENIGRKGAGKGECTKEENPLETGVIPEEERSAIITRRTNPPSRDGPTMFIISMISTGSTPEVVGGTWMRGAWAGKGAVYLEAVAEEGIRGVPPGTVDVVEGGAAGIIRTGT